MLAVRVRLLDRRSAGDVHARRDLHDDRKLPEDPLSIIARPVNRAPVFEAPAFFPGAFS